MFQSLILAICSEVEAAIDAAPRCVPHPALERLDLPVIQFHGHTAAENVDDDRDTAIGFVDGIDIAFLIFEIPFFDANPVADFERDSDYAYAFYLRL